MACNVTKYIIEILNRKSLEREYVSNSLTCVGNFLTGSDELTNVSNSTLLY